MRERKFHLRIGRRLPLESSQEKKFQRDERRHEAFRVEGWEDSP